MITANTATRGITEAQAAALRMADGEFELSPHLSDKLQGLFRPSAKILSSASLSFALKEDRVTIGLSEELESQLPTAKLKLVRQVERSRAPYFMCIVQHEGEQQDPVLLEFREFIEADSPLELMQGLAEVNRTLLLEDALEARGLFFDAVTDPTDLSSYRPTPRLPLREASQHAPDDSLPTPVPLPVQVPPVCVLSRRVDEAQGCGVRSWAE